MQAKHRPITSQPSNEDRIALRVSSDPAQIAAVRKSIESFAQQLGFDERAVAEIGLCVNEAIANIIRHAYAGQTNRPIDVSAWAQGQQLSITLRDWGSGVDPSTLPCRPYDPLEPGGVGLICLHQWMDQVAYTPQPDGMLTLLVRKKTGP